MQINPWLHLRFSASCSRTWRSDGPGPISKPGRYKQPETRRNIGHQPVPSFFSFQFRFEKKITCLFQPSIHHTIIASYAHPTSHSIHPSTSLGIPLRAAHGARIPRIHALGPEVGHRAAAPGEILAKSGQEGWENNQNLPNSWLFRFLIWKDSEIF